MAKNIEIEERTAILKVNPKLYPLATIYSASYTFLDKAYILLDGDPEIQVIIKIMPKDQSNPETMAREFFNELINYADYNERAEQTRKIREMILQRAIITNDPSLLLEEEVDIRDLLEDGTIDDPEDIAVPWELKYGEKRSDQENIKVPANKKNMDNIGDLNTDENSSQ